MNALDKRMTLMTLAWPIFTETFLRMLLGNVNVFMLSQYSDEAVGAVGVVSQLINMILMIYGIVAVGTAVIISQSLGAGQRQKAGQVANVALILNFAFGLLMSAGVALFSEQILRIMNLPEELMPYGVPYLVIVAAASFTQALIATMSAIARNYGQTKISMYVALGMNVINAVGNYIVIFRPFGLPAFGVTGIAVSVVVSEVAALVFMFYVLFHNSDLGLRFRIPKPFPYDTFKDILRIGVPGAAGAVSYNGAQVASTYIITLLGTEALTTRVYVQNLISFALILGLAVGQANQILIGHMVGGGREDEAYSSCIRNLRTAIIANSIVAVLFFLFRRPLIGIFTQDAEIIAMASLLLMVDLVLEPGRAFNLVLGGALQGAGDVRWPVAVGVFSTWGISVTFSYILGIHFGLGLPGVFAAFVLDEWFRGIVLFGRWRSGVWKRMRVVGAGTQKAIKEPA